jgi:hypothetical protein
MQACYARTSLCRFNSAQLLVIFFFLDHMMLFRISNIELELRPQQRLV